MSRTIKILQCRKCGEELYRKVEGEIKESDGRWFSSTQVYLVDERYFSHCTGIFSEVRNND
jgi:hypothetical protein